VNRVAVTGASGYLGSLVCGRFESLGWHVIRLVRSPRPGFAQDRRYDIAEPLPPDLLASADVLVHAAYDFNLTRRADIWRVNVAGTQRLLAAAAAAGIQRIIVFSTMSAYDGTTQLYGQAKLAIEAATLAAGGCVVRPGLVYGEHPGGMAGGLRRAARLPLVPLVLGASGLYPVHEEDLVSAVVALAGVDNMPARPIGVAAPKPVPFRALMETLAGGRRCRFVPIPWQVLYASLRLGELLRLPLPFRADSIIGLVHPAPAVPGLQDLARLGVTLRPFPYTSSQEGSAGSVR
jgi:nucleoside-diphosphate-sugar epimerase